MFIAITCLGLLQPMLTTPPCVELKAPVVVHVGGGAITCEPSPFDDALDSAVRIQREFKAYPTALFARAGCERIVLCTKLAYAGQLRAAIPDWEHNTLYIDTQRGAKSPGYPEHVLHHEFFHLIDHADDGMSTGMTRGQRSIPQDFAMVLVVSMRRQLVTQEPLPTVSPVFLRTMPPLVSKKTKPNSLHSASPIRNTSPPASEQTPP